MEQVALKLAAPVPEFPKLPLVSDVLQVEGGTVYQLYPVQEVKYHNMEWPNLCNCSPTYECLADEDGLIDLVIVEHKWLS